jgi:flavin reductase (DIM6/NTAB) family NADH-FMN oxidoreductase RutF
MENLFELIKPEELDSNIFKMIGSDWMLICAGKKDNYNMMTASWGTAGYLWRKPVVFVFIRPQRHTYSFMETNPYFTVNFFDSQYRDLLTICGTRSGKEIDKMNIDGLEAEPTGSGSIIFKQARIAMECRKIYFDDIKPEFLQAFELEKIYPAKDFHRFYVGEIMNLWRKK